VDENLVQARVIYLILHNLSDHDLLSSDPLTVAIEREDRPPIYPCARGFPGGPVDIGQLEWAEREGKFWFLLPIKTLWIELDDRKKRGKNIGAITWLLNQIASDAGFGLEFERYNDVRAR